MRNLRFSFSLCTVSVLLAFGSADGFAESWEKMYDTNGRFDADLDTTTDVLQTADGGFILCGSVRSADTNWRNQVLLVRTDGKGKELWTRTYTGFLYPYAAARSIDQTRDGGFIMVGSTFDELAPNRADVLLIRTAADGQELWRTTFGGPLGDYGSEVHETADADFIVVGTVDYGYSSQSAMLFHLDSEGHELWSRNLGCCTGRSVQQTVDGGFIVAGQTTGGEFNSDALLVRTNPEGNELWRRSFDAGLIDQAYSVKQTSDGGFIVTGEASRGSVGRSADLFLLRTNGNGDPIWDRYFGGDDIERGYDVEQTSDGGFIVAGETHGLGPIWPPGIVSQDVYLLRADSDGNELWSKTFGGPQGDLGFSVQQTDDGGFVVAAVYSHAVPPFDIGNDGYLIYYNPDTPTPKIEANGSGLPIRVRQGEPLSITLALETGSFYGRRANWYVVAETRLGTYHLDRGFASDLGDWQPGLKPTLVAPLVPLPRLKVDESVPPLGSYTLYFAVSLEGSLYLDSVPVEVIP